MKDHRGHEITGATAAGLELYERALQQVQRYRNDPMATIESALADAPSFAMARALKAWLGLLSTERSGVELARTELAALEGLPLTAREAGHKSAIRALCDGDWGEAIAALDVVLADEPHDVLALQVAHLGCFFTGDTRNLRDVVARVRATWTADVPGFPAVLGMHAFGHEECGDYARAERDGRAALDLDPADAWAHHAVAHVFEMTGRVEDGVRWMTSREADWSTDNFFAIHNHWHHALFLIDRGDSASALAIYDERIRKGASKVTLDLVDASALLWRLQLRDVAVGARWAELADAWAPTVSDGLYAFNDVHAVMAFLGADRRDLVDQLRATMRGVRTGDNAAMTRAVGSPVVDALVAFVDGDYARCKDTLRRVRTIAQRMGGSHAQRDVLDQTLAVAALRSGDRAMAVALERERTYRRAPPL